MNKNSEQYKQWKETVNRDYGKVGNRINFFDALKEKEQKVQLNISDNWQPLETEKEIINAAYMIGEYITDTGLVEALIPYSDNPGVQIVFDALESRRKILTPEGYVPGEEIYVPFLYQGYVEGEIPNSILKINHIVISVESIDIIARVQDKSFREVATTVLDALNDELRSGIRQQHISVMKRP